MLQVKFTARIVFYAFVFIVISFLSACDEQVTPADTIVPIVDFTHHCEYLRWSPDGGKIAIWVGYPGDFNIFVWDKELEELTKLNLHGPAIDPISFDIEYEFGLTWTPDGEYLLCSVEVDSAKGIEEGFWQISVDDGYTVEIEMPNDQLPIFPEIAPNGEWLTYSIFGNEDSNIWKIAIQPGMPISLIGDPIQLTYDGGWSSRWSPDGTIIAYTHVYGDCYQIFTIPASGGEPTQITPNDGYDHEWKTWSPYEAWLAYTSNPPPGPMELWRIPSMGGEPIQITDYGGPYPWCCGDWCPDWSPDGEWIAFISDGRNDGSVFLIKMQ